MEANVVADGVLEIPNIYPLLKSTNSHQFGLNGFGGV